jgi:C_GCAxxG_C_C family probable redox protein
MTDVRMLFLELGSKGYSCAQMLVIGALRLMDRDNPDLVRAVAGLAQGVRCGELCGALSGGACLLSIYTAKGLDSETPHDKGPLLISELTDWFADELCQGNGMTCAAILSRILDSVEDSNASDKRRRCETHCINMVVRVWEKCLELLRDNGFEVTEGRNLK